MRPVEGFLVDFVFYLAFLIIFPILNRVLDKKESFLYNYLGAIIFFVMTFLKYAIGEKASNKVDNVMDTVSLVFLYIVLAILVIFLISLTIYVIKDNKKKKLTEKEKESDENNENTKDSEVVNENNEDTKDIKKKEGN